MRTRRPRLAAGRPPHRPGLSVARRRATEARAAGAARQTQLAEHVQRGAEDAAGAVGRPGHRNRRPRVGPEGGEAVSGKGSHAPGLTNSPVADRRVTAQAGARTVADYVIPDPRLAEVDTREGPGGGQRVLPEARTIIFAPLAEDLTDIRLAPVRGREEKASKGGTLDARALDVRACEAQTALEECHKILRSKPGTTQSPTPTPTPAQPPRAQG